MLEGSFVAFPQAAIIGAIAMRKTTIIATCLVNSGMFRELEVAEQDVTRIFHEDFPHKTLHIWDHEIPDDIAADIIAAAGRSGIVNVKRLIEDLP